MFRARANGRRPSTGHRLDLRLDNGLDTTEHAGYWPVEVSGSRSGFEYYVGPIADAFGSEAPVGVDDRDFVVNFVTHSDLKEPSCSMFAATAWRL